MVRFNWYVYVDGVQVLKGNKSTADAAESTAKTFATAKGYSDYTWYVYSAKDDYSWENVQQIASGNVGSGGAVSEKEAEEDAAGAGGPDTGTYNQYYYGDRGGGAAGDSSGGQTQGQGEAAEAGESVGPGGASNVDLGGSEAPQDSSWMMYLVVGILIIAIIAFGLKGGS